MTEPYDPTKAPLGPMGGRNSRRGEMIKHNRMVLARRNKRLREKAATSSGDSEV